MITRWYQEKTLIVVPTTSLVLQMTNDFISYGANPKWIHNIKAGENKQTDRPIVISTWQSLFKMPRSYFDQYKLVIGDECHLFKAKSLTGIMENLVDCPYRFVFTGSLD